MITATWIVDDAVAMPLPATPGQGIGDKTQISFADTEAHIMGKNGHFDYAYNARISVDADLQIIVGQHISQNANDKQKIEPALKALQDTADRLSEQLSADNGSLSGDNLQALEQSRTESLLYRH